MRVRPTKRQALLPFVPLHAVRGMVRFLEAVVQLSDTPSGAPLGIAEFVKLENGRWVFDSKAAVLESAELLRTLESFRLWRNRFEERVLIGEEGWVTEMWSLSGRANIPLSDGSVIAPQECLGLAIALLNVHEQLIERRFIGTMLVGDAGGLYSGRDRSFLTGSGVLVQFHDTHGVSFGDKFIAVGETHPTSGDDALEGLSVLFSSSKSVHAEVTAISVGWAAACAAVSRLALKAGTSNKSLAIRLVV